MAYLRCGIGGKNPFSVFENKTYITTGISPYQSRVTILDGGYCIENGLCYVKMKLKANVSFNVSTYTVGISGMPTVTSDRGLIGSSSELEDIKTMTSDNFKVCGNVNTSEQISFYNFNQNDVVWFYGIYPTSAT